MVQIVEDFKSLFNQLESGNCRSGLIEKVYATNLHFEDSFHKIEGVGSFVDYCENLYENVKHISFDFHQTFIDLEKGSVDGSVSGEAMLTWTMHYSHPRLKWGKPIHVEGASLIRFKDKVYYHRDYFDGGQLLYEHVPLLGTVVSSLKKRLG